MLLPPNIAVLKHCNVNVKKSLSKVNINQCFLADLLKITVFYVPLLLDKLNAF